MSVFVTLSLYLSPFAIPAQLVGHFEVPNCVQKERFGEVLP